MSLTRIAVEVWVLSLRLFIVCRYLNYQFLFFRTISFSQLPSETPPWGLSEMLYKLIKKFYNEEIEDFCTRLLYFFNTIDSFFIFAGFLAAFLCVAGDYPIQWFIIFGVITIFAILISDFHPLFIALSLPHVFFLFYLLEAPLS